jgi:hypothetical protein
MLRTSQVASLVAAVLAAHPLADVIPIAQAGARQALAATSAANVGPGDGSTCYANCDGSTTQPILTVNDFLCFQARFAAGDPYANCDGSTSPPVLNVNDFLCFQNAFARGCL